MLINFKVSNFRSIKDEQVLSLVAGNYDRSLPENLISPSLTGIPKLKLLKGAGISGANASGKSNVLSGLLFMSNFVRKSATRMDPGDPTGVTPFCLDSKYLSKPSSFEINVIIEGVRYDYGFSLDRQKVVSEFLSVYPKGSAQRWFDRTFDETTNEYVWKHSAVNFKFDKDLRDKTRPNSLFVSTGAQFNNLQLMPLYNWFKSSLFFINLGADAGFAPNFTASLIEDKKPQVKAIIELLKTADFGIIDASVQHREMAPEEIRDNVPPLLFREIEKDGKLTQMKIMEIKLRHKGNNNGESMIDFSEESAGTRRFFSLLGPWLDTLEQGYTVLLDELETSLHPLLVREILRLLFSNKVNSKGAQIIFTTHNPFILDIDLIRRDQIWFTEKDEEGGTHLYPLTDYKPRNNESLTRGYLAGRYGAVPFIPDGLKKS